MSLSRIFLVAIVLYLLYGFVFNFLVPVFRTARQVKKQFRNMEDAAATMREQMNNQGQTPPFQQESTAQAAQARKKSEPLATDNIGEYIDFEEVKK